MFKRFLIVFMTVCSFVMGADLEKYRLYVKDIDTEFHVVALTNGLVCNVIEKDWGMEKSLEIGEEVEFRLIWQKNIEQKKSKQETGEFGLVALRDHDILGRVWLTEESKLNTPSYVSLSTCIVQLAGWFSSEVTQKIVELSDGSKWEIDENWQEEFPQGNHVFFSFSKTNGKVYLVTLDKVETLKIYSFFGWINEEHLINNIMTVKPYEAGSN